MPSFAPAIRWSVLVVLLTTHLSFGAPVATLERTYDNIHMSLRVAVYPPGDPVATGNPIPADACRHVLTDHTYVFDIGVFSRRDEVNSLAFVLDIRPERVIRGHGSDLPGTAVAFTPERHLVFSFNPPLTSETRPANHYFTSPMLPGPCTVGFGVRASAGHVSKTFIPEQLGPHAAPVTDCVHYVDGDARGTGDGSCWRDAHTHLQDAIEAAAASGGEIRVAHGVYRPDRDLAHPQGTGDRDATFAMVSNITIKGGYAGWDEPDPNARDAERYETVLSGDLSGNDSTRELRDAIVNEPRRADNSRHIVTASAVDATAVLDGFTVAHGHCGALNVMGGAVHASGSPTIVNCRFVRNTAGYDPAAYPPKPGKAPPASRGGAVFVRGLRPGSDTSPCFMHCIFQNNCAQEGSALYAINCHPLVINCTVVGNIADSGGTIDTLLCSPTVVNCILWGNVNGGGMNEATQMAFLDSSGPETVDFCCIQGLRSLRGSGNIGDEPLFVDQPGGDYHLRSQAGRWHAGTSTWIRDTMTSPCIDAGARSSPLGAEPFPNGGLINMGAYGGTARASKSYFGAPPCETVVAGDINGDCRVDWTDLSLLAIHWCNKPAGMPLPPSRPASPPPPPTARHSP